MQGVDWGATGCFSHGKDVKSELADGVGLFPTFLVLTEDLQGWNLWCLSWDRIFVEILTPAQTTRFWCSTLSYPFNWIECVVSVMCVSAVGTFSQTVQPTSSAKPIFALRAPVKCYVMTVTFYTEFEPTFTPLVFLSYIIFICFLPHYMRSPYPSIMRIP